MWYQDSVTFSVGATSSSTPSASPASAARAQSERAMKQSVSSGMCGPCCSVVPIGISTASTPRPIAASTSGQVMRSMKRSAIRTRSSLECQTSCNTRPSPTGRARWRDGRRSTASSSGTRSPARASPSSRSTAPGFGHFNFAPATPGARRALQGRRLRHARLRAVRPAGAGLRHGGLGRRRRRPDGRARHRRRRTSTAPRWAG